jgi:putative zinc finger protein
VTHDCRQVRDLLDSYIGGELQVETNHAVLEHLSRCRACSGELERRQTLIALLRQEQHRIEPDVGALRRRIDAAIDREQRWWTRLVGRWPVAAATLVAIGALSWYVFRGQAVDAAAYRDSIANHVECALTRPATMTYDAERVARRLPPEYAVLAERFREWPGADRLIDAHACPYKERRYTHFVFRENGRTTSLFVDDHPQGALPRTALADEAGFHVTAASTPHHQLFIVSDLTVSRAAPFLHDLLGQSVEMVEQLERAHQP